MAVIDKGDFANSTSSNHYKFIHGGIRYLQHLDIARLRESSRERSALIRIAPHLAYPMPVVLPTYGHGRRGKPLMRAAMLAYDILTVDRNSGIKDPTRRTPNGSTLGRDQVLKMFPGIPAEGLTGAAVFYDGQMYNPARLVLAFLRSAHSLGAIVSNYVSADRLVYEDNRIVGCAATDGLTENKFEIRARMVVNAAGPWGSRLLSQDGSAALTPEPSFSRDLAFVANKSVCESHAVGLQAASADSDALLDRGGRHLFLVPWRGMTLVGVWHRYSLAHPDRLSVSREELQQYLDEINGAYSGLNLGMDDISMINTGHILFGSEAAQESKKDHSFAKRSLLVDHAKDGVDGIVTVIGARATVARGVAEKTLNLIQRKLGETVTASNTERKLIHGGAFVDFEALVSDIRDQLPTESQNAARAIAHNYGSEFPEILGCARDSSNLRTVGQTNTIAAEAVHAVRYEMATCLEDVVLRRTELGTGGDPGRDALEQIASVVSAELGWDTKETAAQTQSVHEILQRCGPWRFVDHSAELEAAAS